MTTAKIKGLIRIGFIAFIIALVIVLWNGGVVKNFRGAPQEDKPAKINTRNFAESGKTMSRDEALTHWASFIQSSLPPRASFEEEHKRDALMNSLEAQTASADLPFLLEGIAKLPPSDEKDHIMTDFLGRLGFADPEMSIVLTKKYIDDEKKQDGIIEGIFTHLSVHDPQLGLTLLSKLPSGPQAQLDYAGFFGYLAQNNGGSDAASVGAEAFNLPTGPERSAALQSVVSVWANFDPKAALDWAASLPTADRGAGAQALMKIARQQPAQAAQYLGILQDASVRNQAIQTISQAWATGPGQDPAGALDWLDSVATGDTYDANVKYLLTTYSKQNPAAAATLLAKVTEPDLRAGVIASVAANWAKKDPQAASAWLQSLPGSDATARAAALKMIQQAQTTQ